MSWLNFSRRKLEFLNWQRTYIGWLQKIWTKLSCLYPLMNQLIQLLEVGWLYWMLIWECTWAGKKKKLIYWIHHGLRSALCFHLQQVLWGEQGAKFQEETLQWRENMRQPISLSLNSVSVCRAALSRSGQILGLEWLGTPSMWEESIHLRSCSKSSQCNWKSQEKHSRIGYQKNKCLHF